MNELAPITSSTTSMLISFALDAAMLRHAAIARNIANANNEGYRPLRVDFERHVELLKNELLSRDDAANAARAVEDLRAALKTTQAPEAQAVALDVEVGKMTQNALHYQALLAARSKLSAFMRLALGGGR